MAQLCWTRVSLIATTTAATALQAAAGVPEALDRVPADAPIVVGVKNVEEVLEKMRGVMALGGAEAMADGMVEQLLAVEGIDFDQPAAAVLMPEQFDVTVVIVAAVDDFAALAAGGTLVDGIYEMSVEGESAYFKDLGGGYAAIGDVHETVKGFAAVDGQGAAHERRLGATGSSVIESNDVFVIANMDALGPTMKQQWAAQQESLRMMAQMAGAMAQGADLAAPLELVETVVAGFLDDAQSATAGVTFDEAGISVDLGAQFRDGSEVAGFFDGGSSTDLIGRVPNIDFIAAYAYDMSAPGMRALMENLTPYVEKIQALGGGNATTDMDLIGDLGEQGGIAGVIGVSPAMMQTGLLSRQVAYYRTGERQKARESFMNSVKGLDGQTTNGVVSATSYEPGAAEVNGVKVDKYSIAVSLADQNDPAAMQMNMGMMMMFGPGMGPSGFLAPVTGGIVQTLSQDQALLTTAMEAAASGDGLSRHERLGKTASRLQKNRSMEMYVAVDEALNMVGPMMAMMGAGPEIPRLEDTPPVGVGVTTDKGGMSVRVFVPQALVAMVAELVQAQGQGEQADEIEF